MGKVGRLPLAIVQAGSFIKMSKDSLGSYLARLCQKLPKLLFADFKVSGKLYADGIISCWRLSIAALSRDAARLLTVCAFLSNEEILIEMLCKGITAMSWFDEGTFWVLMFPKCSVLWPNLANVH